MPLCMEVGLDPSDIVLDGNPAPPPQKGGRAAPNFWPCLSWPNGCMDQDAAWYAGRPLPRPHCATWGPTSRSPKRGRAPQFSAHVCCGQTAGWIKMPIGTMVGLGRTTLCYMQAQLHHSQGAQPPDFGPCRLWPNGCMDQDATYYECRRLPKPHCITWDPAPSSQKRHSPLVFGPCLLWPNGCPSQPLLSTFTAR